MDFMLNLPFQFVHWTCSRGFNQWTFWASPFKCWKVRFSRQDTFWKLVSRKIQLKYKRFNKFSVIINHTRVVIISYFAVIKYEIFFCWYELDFNFKDKKYSVETDTILTDMLIFDVRLVDNQNGLRKNCGSESKRRENISESKWSQNTC